MEPDEMESAGLSTKSFGVRVGANDPAAGSRVTATVAPGGTGAVSGTTASRPEKSAAFLGVKDLGRLTQAW